MQNDNITDSNENIDPVLLNYINNNYTSSAGVSLILSINLIDKYTDLLVQEQCLDLVLSDNEFDKAELVKSVRDTIEEGIDDIFKNIGMKLFPEVSLLTKCSIIIAISSILVGDNVPVLSGILAPGVDLSTVIGIVIPLVSSLSNIQVSMSVESVSSSLIKRIMDRISLANSRYEAENEDISNTDTLKIKNDLKNLSKLYKDKSVLSVKLIEKGVEIGLMFTDYIPYLKESTAESEESKYLDIASLLIMSSNGNQLPITIFKTYADEIFVERKDIENCSDFISILVTKIEMQNRPERNTSMRVDTYE